MIDHIPSLTSLIDRCAHRAAMHFRTKTALLNNAAPIVSFTFDDVPESAFSVGAATLDAHGVKGTFYIAGALCDTVDSDGRSLITSPECLELHRRGHGSGATPSRIARWAPSIIRLCISKSSVTRRFFPRLIPASSWRISPIRTIRRLLAPSSCYSAASVHVGLACRE